MNVEFKHSYHVAIYQILRWLYPQGGMRFGRYPLKGNLIDTALSVVPRFLSSWLITKKVFHGRLILERNRRMWRGAAR